MLWSTTKLKESSKTLGTRGFNQSVKPKAASTTYKILENAILHNQVIWDTTALVASLREHTRGVDKTKSSDVNLVPLVEPYFVLLDATGVHRPVYAKQYSPHHEFHRLSLNPRDTMRSPFIKQAASSDDLPKQAPPHTFSLAAVPWAQQPPPEMPAVEEYRITDDLERLRKNPEAVKKLQSKVNWDRSGFCERCQERFNNLYTHSQSDAHRRQSLDPRNWMELDHIIATFESNKENSFLMKKRPCDFKEPCPLQKKVSRLC